MRLTATEREAAVWLGKRDRGFSPAEKIAFEAWVSGDPIRAVAVREIERTWTRLDGLQRMSRGRDVDPDALEVKAHGDHALHLLRAVGWGGLAAAAAVAFALWTNGRRGGASPPTLHFASDAGKFRHIALEDGSTLDLNRGSAVDVRYEPGRRTVRLLRGEAGFQVVGNVSRPFFVFAGAVRVRDVGTAFDVRLAPEAVTVLVTEGRVQVTGAAPKAISAAWPGDSQTVQAGQQATVAAQSVAVAAMSTGEIARAVSWMRQPIELEDLPLSDLVAQFNRVNSHPVRIADPDLAAMKISGSFALDNEDAFVSLLGSAYGVTADRTVSGEIILRRGR